MTSRSEAKEMVRVEIIALLEDLARCADETGTRHPFVAGRFELPFSGELAIACREVAEALR